MKKKAYEKPEMKVVLMQYHTNILAGSPTPPDSPDYDDWLGAPPRNGDADWDDEEDEEEDW
jgi:hypothetical protein